MKTLVIIPSRMSATRLPGKPLLKINGLSIISHVSKKAEEANIGDVIVATEDQEIIDDVKGNGFNAIMTSNKHKTGTDRIHEAFKKLNIKNQRGGTYVVMEGPQFSTLAESNLYRSWGADVIGMTNMPEAKLAREAEIRYCTVAMVTDYDCWHPDHDEVDVSMVIETLMKNAANAQNMIKEVIKTFKNFSVEKDPANNCLDVAIITDPKLRSKKTIKKLKNIAGRVLNKKN